MKSIVSACALVGLLLGGWARAEPVAGVYFHSDGLAQQADSIDAAVQGSSTLKPYDDQLINLATFATEEDLAVATRVVAERDASLLQLVSQPADDSQHHDARVAEIITEACQELTLVGSALAAGSSLPPRDPCRDPTDPAKLNVTWLKSQARLERIIEDHTQAQAAVKASILRFTRLYPKLPTPTCDSAAQEAATAEAQDTKNAASDLADMATTQCIRVTNDEAKLGRLGWPLADTSIGAQVMQASDADQREGAAVAAATLKSLQAQLDAAQAATKARTNLGALQTIEDDLQKGLSAIDPVVKLAKLDRVQGELDQVEAALVCGTTCTSPPSGSVGVKAAAVIGVLNALAQSKYVAAERAPISNWVAAAQAIVGFYKADAQIEADADAAMAAISAQRQALAAHEAMLLSKAVLLAVGDFRDVGDVSGCDATTAFYCALPEYVASWNEGRAPAKVLEYRQVQVFRAFVVKRQRQAAQAQRSVLLAATATLKAYGDGGVQPPALAQLLGALGIVAIAAK